MLLKDSHKRTLVLLVITLFLTVGNVHAQSNSFLSYRPINIEHSKKLYLRFESASFLQNNEYFSPFAYGYTSTGYFVKPSLEYTFNRHLKANIGIFLLQYSGIDHFTQTLPVFSIQYKITKSLDLVMGNIYGTANHRLEQPLFRYESYYQDHMEYGLQFLWHSKRVQSDLWLHWEHFIQLGDTAQEQLMIGNSSRFLLYSHNKIKLILPIQFTIIHNGGQLEPAPHLPIRTIFDGLSGLRLRYEINAQSYIQFSQLFAVYKCLSEPLVGEAGHMPFAHGWGSYSKISFQKKHFHAMAGYWHGYRFIAPEGETQFQSVSEINPSYTQDIRSLITAKVWFRKSISKGMQLEARTSAYFDTDSRKLDYSYSLYVIINRDFFLTKVKHN